MLKNQHLIYTVIIVAACVIFSFSFFFSHIIKLYTSSLAYNLQKQNFIQRKVDCDLNPCDDTEEGWLNVSCYMANYEFCRDCIDNNRIQDDCDPSRTKWKTDSRGKG